MKGKQPNTPGFWMEYRDLVAGLLPNGIIKKGELDRLMCFYINGQSVDECVEWIKQQRKKALL